MNPVAVIRSLFWRVQRPLVDRARAYAQKVQLWRARHVACASARDGPLAESAARHVLEHLAHHSLPQPDRHTCASSAMVLLRMLRDPTLAEEVLGSPQPEVAFGRAATGVLHRTNGWLDARRRPQLPWPLRWGSRPAGLLRLLNAPEGYGEPGRRYRNRTIDPIDAGPMYDAIRAEVESGEPVLLFTGDRRWFKHTVLVVEATAEQLTVYEPTRGRLVRMGRPGFIAGELEALRWRTPWLVLLPDRAAGQPLTPPPKENAPPSRLDSNR